MTNEAYDAAFQASLDEDSVAWGEVVEAKVRASTKLTSDPMQLAIGERYFPLLLQSFRKTHKGVEFAIQEDAGIGVVLHTADQGDPAGDRIDWAVIRRTLRFEWNLPRVLLVETQQLGEEVRRWVRNPSERRDLMSSLYNVMTQIGATIGRENRRTASNDEGDKPSEHIEHDVSIIKKQLDAARDQFRAETERAAQFRYALGMVRGAVGALMLWGIAAGILALQHIDLINVVGFASGAVGACVSVLERMTRGKLEINAQSGDRMIMGLGALRPVVGAIFGYVVFLIIRAELISLFVLPKSHSGALAYVAAFGFVAGFNERFAQDVLANASNARVGND